jgi:hypothetical protein
VSGAWRQGLSGDPTYLIVKEDSTLESFGGYLRMGTFQRVMKGSACDKLYAWKLYREDSGRFRTWKDFPLLTERDREGGKPELELSRSLMLASTQACHSVRGWS